MIKLIDIERNRYIEMPTLQRDDMDIQLSEFLISYKGNDYKLQVANERIWFVLKESKWKRISDTEELERMFSNIKV